MDGCDCTCTCHAGRLPHPTLGMNTNRLPAGTPDGGQFAPGSTLEAPVVLRSTPQDGSFHYPPAFTTAQQLVDFYWSSVPIPEEVLPKVQNAYEAHRAQAINEQMAAWDEANPVPEEGRFRKGQQQQWEAARAQAVTDARGRFQHDAVTPLWARPLTRCIKMSTWATTLPPDEKAKFHALTFQMPDGRSYPSDRVCDDFHIDHWFRSAVNPPTADEQGDGWQERELLVSINRSLDRIGRRIMETNNRVDALHEQVYEGQQGM